MAISTPILYSVGFVVGLFAVARSFLTRPREILADAKNRNNVLFLTWFFTPVLAVVLLKSVVYDSWRHLFFIYPAFLLVAVQGLQWLIAVARRRAACLHFALIAAVALVTLHTAVVMARLHPFEYLYFNMLAGRDMATAQRRFDFDYWGLSYRKGLEWVLKNDPRDKVKIYVTEAPGLTNAFLTPPPQRKRLQYVYSVDQADYVLSTRRWPGPGDNCPDKRYAVMVGNAEALVVCRR
jgi:hypothetical protein